eukprot:10407881-Alexandrium_andersonii.AAC.1
MGYPREQGAARSGAVPRSRGITLIVHASRQCFPGLARQAATPLPPSWSKMDQGRGKRMNVAW